MSCVTPLNAAPVTLGETPAACASADMLSTNVLKSPPQRAAKDGGERVMVQSTTAKRSIKVFLLMNWPGEVAFHSTAWSVVRGLRASQTQQTVPDLSPTVTI